MVSGTVLSDDRVVVYLTNVADTQVITVTIPNLTDTAGNSSTNVVGRMGVLIGDSTSDGLVNSGDASQTRNRSGQATNTTNFRSDFNADGVVNSGDVVIARARSGSSIP